MTRCRGRRRVKNLREQRKGVQGLQAVNRDGTVAATKQITGNGKGADEAQRQRAWEKDGNDGATTPAQAMAGAMRRDGEDTVRGRCRGSAESTRGAVASASMVVAASPLGGF